jgi:osmotically-inducible protein OsmY
MAGAFFMTERKETSMKNSNDPELAAGPDQFATGDATEDHELKWRIMACFQCRIPEVTGIRVTVFGNTAVLRGNVRSSHDKRICLECCRHVPGVMRVVDDLTTNKE